MASSGTTAYKMRYASASKLERELMTVQVSTIERMSANNLAVDMSPRALVKRHATCVLRAALAGGITRSNADDIVQKAFLQLVRLRPNFKNDEHAKAWLLRVAINLCKDQHRSMWQREVDSLDELQENSTTQHEIADTNNVLASGAAKMSAEHSPEAAFIAKEQRASIKRATAQLSAKQRICIHLFYYEDLTVNEIALVTEMTPSTVKSHLHRGRAKLQVILGEEYDYEA